ncbi:MAG: 7-carboxy-7-deazaguanine synthase QueE [Flavobacteriales bacterium]|nr:7-carboxy-7-deazaguanine synthase QueE [Flavobacteriales bacterium]
MEAFYTLQGEGFQSGRAAYFIRLAGCDVGCHWCDVKESWEVGREQLKNIDQLVEEALAQPARFAVITGGEPLIYNLDSLCHILIAHGFELAIETSGAYPLSGEWHWICLSPKKRMEPLEEVYQKANELKVVIYNQDDFRWAEEQRKKVSANCLLYLQPEWSKADKMQEHIINYIKENPAWRISLQSHKYLDIP